MTKQILVEVEQGGQTVQGTSLSAWWVGKEEGWDISTEPFSLTLNADGFIEDVENRLMPENGFYEADHSSWDEPFTVDDLAKEIVGPGNGNVEKVRAALRSIEGQQIVPVLVDRGVYVVVAFDSAAWSTIGDAFRNGRILNNEIDEETGLESGRLVKRNLEF